MHKSIGDLKDFQCRPISSDQGLQFEDTNDGNDSDSGLEELMSGPK